MKLSFSLSNKNTKLLGVAPPLPKPAAFSSLDDEDAQDIVPIASSSKDAIVNKTLLARNVASSKATQKRMEQEMKIDDTVYQYDEVWDRMQEVKQRQKEAKEADAKQRKVGLHSFVFARAFSCSVLAQIHRGSAKFCCYSSVRSSQSRGEDDPT